MGYTHHDTGKLGEELAIQFLQQLGYSILVRNWRFKRYEMDIIAVKDNVLHFIEVKTRNNDAFGYPEERISKGKIKTMMRTGTAFQYQHPKWRQVQYDILSVTLLNNKPEFFFIEDVYC